MSVLVDQTIRSRFILAPCEKGALSDPQQLRLVLKQEKDLYSQHPNFVHYHCENVFAFKAGETPRPAVEPSLTKAARRLTRLFRPVQRNPVTQIGIPRTLNLWRYAPFFNGYLKTVLSGKAVVRWSAQTSDRLLNQGSHSICADQCFPGKYTLAHVYDLLDKGVDLIFNPALVSLDSSAATHQCAAACPVAMANPDVIKAALATSDDIFLKNKTPYHAPVLHMNSPDLFDRQLFVFSRSVLGASCKRHAQVLRHGWNSYYRFYQELQSRAGKTINQLIDQNRIGILFLGRPYHYDPGLHHGVPEQLQKRGYPIFTIESLPRNKAFISRLIAQELAMQSISDPFEIRDVWKHSLRVFLLYISITIMQARITPFQQSKLAVDS
jgi:predicted nucleotide-binding protein (sugar kinase/HSP70/actin superfamily)